MRWRILLLSAFWLIPVSTGGFESINADSNEPLLAAMEQQLQADTARQGLLVQRLSVLQQAQYTPITPDLLTKAFLQRLTTVLVMQEAEIGNIELTIKSAQMEVECTQTGIQNSQRRHLDVRRHLSILPEIEHTVRDQMKLLEVQQKRVRILQNTRDTLNKTVALTKDWYKQLQIKSQSTVQDERKATLNAVINQLHHTQKAWIDQLEGLSNQMGNQENMDSIAQMTDFVSMLQTISTEEKSNGLHIQLSLETIANELHTLCDTLAHEPPLMILNTLQKPLESSLNHLQNLEDLLKKKCVFIKDNLRLGVQEQATVSSLERDKLKRIIVELQQRCSEYESQLNQVVLLMGQTQSAQSLFTRQLHAYLSSRQDLPGLDRLAWVNIVEQLKEIPGLLSARIIGLFSLAMSKVKQSSWMQFSLAALITLAWARMLVLIKQFMKAQHLRLLGPLSGNEEKGQSLTFFSFCLSLLNRYIDGLVLFLSIWSLLLVWKIPVSAFVWLVGLMATSLTFSVAIQTCRFWLVNTVSEEGHIRNKAIYYRLHGILSVGRLLTLFSLLVHQLILDYEVRNLVARLFMFFLFIIALALFRVWTLVPKLLEGYWAQRPRYLKQVVRWLSFLLPMTLLLNAILGLVGYVQLAWAIVGYQSVLLLALCIYPFIKGLLNECFHWLSEQSIRRLRNGWLWNEALLKPLYQLLKLFALVSIIILFFSFAGWREELITWSHYPAMWFNKPLMTVLDIPIDTWKIIQVAMMSGFIAWLSRWTREFAYRWIFSNLKDLGLRNSLSVFTQYMAIFLSVLATLQIVGLTLSVLKYILSGFAIGLSFGLRDLFNNFVTGILLLVERPVKVGDWVTVGDHDGQVVHIGARSITINTEDHQELMVPNADLFYKHFINWTRHDSIVRITLPLFVHRRDDPVRIRELILEVIGTIPKILNNPSPGVYFKATDQMLLSFKIEYYVDLTQITSRSEVNSTFLFALWKRFGEANITPPEVVHELHVKGQLGLDKLSHETQGG